MNLTLKQIAKICKGTVVGEASGRLNHVCTDSRQPTHKDSLFFALQGPRFNGHDFVAQVQTTGAAVVVSDSSRLHGGRAVVVADTTQALQALATYWREEFKGIVVGITGSNGKTIVKEMLAAILGRRFAVHRSPGSFNSQIGVPLSLLGIRNEHQIALIEAGISQVGEMEKLAAMIKPDCGVLTTVGAAHHKGLGQLTAREKLRLFTNTRGMVVLPAEFKQATNNSSDINVTTCINNGFLKLDPISDRFDSAVEADEYRATVLATKMSSDIDGSGCNHEVFSDLTLTSSRSDGSGYEEQANDYGRRTRPKENNSDTTVNTGNNRDLNQERSTFRSVEELLAVELRADGTGFSFRVVTPPHSFDVRLNVPGSHNVHNALCAAALALELGATEADVREGLASFELAPMRLEMLTTSSGVTLINDAYSSDPVSADAALEALHYYAGGARTVAVLGDMLDLGTDTTRLHERLGRSVADHNIDILVGYGTHGADIVAGSAMAASVTHSVATINDLSKLLDNLLEPGDFVLFKGSRQIGLDVAAAALIESTAPTRLHIDLDAIRHNVHVLRTHLGSEVKLLAVVKSFAYGNDATRVSQTLIREGIDALAVAYPDEAIPLRTRGMNIPILVTNALAEEADKIIKYRLTPLVYSRKVVNALSTQAVRRGVSVDVHIEVDTGMSRVGLLPRDVLAFARWVREVESVNVTGLMTHFAAADDPEQDDFTRLQISKFEGVITSLRGDGFDLRTVHAANTAAAWRFPTARYDMVRVGLGLYGYHPSKTIQAEAWETRPALEFRTQVIHVKTIETGDTVSYGRTWTANEPRTIATIAAGYNDGFPRFMSNGGFVLIRGVRCPVVGNVCMDVSMIDVTHVEDVTEGDDVVLFGKQEDTVLSVDEIAARGDTINYEILCKISPRVRRLFSREI